MAQCKSSPQDFIKNAFTPQISVMCTPETQKLCQKNNLTFTEVLQPFSKFVIDASYKDPSGNATTIKNLKLSFVDIKLKPPQTNIARKLLNSSVNELVDPTTKICHIKNYQVEVPLSTPWFESWRDTFLQVQYPSDHEFTKHFLGCILVVSSSDNNPVDNMTELVQSLNQIQSSAVPEKLPKWFSSNALKYYVILHDNVEGDFGKANKAFESLKLLYGPSDCFLLKINSRPPGLDSAEHPADPWSQFLQNKIDSKTFQSTSAESSPDPKRHGSPELAQEVSESRNLIYHPLSPEVENVLADLELQTEQPVSKKDAGTWRHGSCFSVDDIDQIKAMIYEFAKSCLLPYIEKQLVLLNDTVANKKGVSKSLISATKRWFSSSKPNANVAAINNLIYPADSPELQIRRLGDLYFMFGNYSAAFQAYHTAKRDYNADQAWLYYAGALEMAALSAFMANECSRKTFDYMEESITTYLVTCKMPQFATRATILSSECLKSKQLYGETAHQLIRMTSEDSDLRSALLLEQASYCFLKSSMLRKYAFHMVLAGHRFFKAGQKKHSLRCYKQAYQIYENTGWDLASDHIHYTIGRLANNLQKFDEAVVSFAKLLTGESKQSGSQQATFLKEYLTILESKFKEEGANEIFILSVPELNNSSIKVLVGPTRPLSTPGKVPAMGVHFNSCSNPRSERRWHKLEEMLLSEETGSPPLIFKPMVTLYTIPFMAANTLLAVINEPIQVSVQLVNSLQTVLMLKDIYLLWSFESNIKVSNLEPNPDVDKFVKTYVTKSIIIQGNSKQELILSLTPLVTGNVTISAICYSLTGSTNNTDSITVKGKKLFDISGDKNNIKPIFLRVVPYAPCLQMTFSELNLDFLSGELQRVSVDLQNTGSVPLKNVLIATSVPHLLSNCELKTDHKEYTINDGETPQIKEKLSRKNHITAVPLAGGLLESGQSVSFHIWVRAPCSRGATAVDMLTYYENVDNNSIPRYRLIRHCWNLSVQESISVEICTQTSFNSKSAEDLTMALKTTNLNKIHNSLSTEITLQNIVLLSDNWTLTKDIVTPKYISLNSQESAHILFKARRKVNRKENNYSNIRLSSDNPSVPHLSKAYKIFGKKNHTPLLNGFNLNRVHKKRDGTLILEWKALVYDSTNKRIVYGHTCVPIRIDREEEQLEKLISDTVTNLSSSVICNENQISEKSDNRIIYNLLYPSFVRHNFQETNTCIVPVTLVLHSLVEDNVSIIIDTLESSSKPNLNTPNLYSMQPTSNFSWLINGKIKRTMEPLSTISVKLSVILASPGTFDLGANLKIFCTRLEKDDVPVLQLYEVPSSLIVVDAGS